MPRSTRNGASSVVHLRRSPRPAGARRRRRGRARRGRSSCGRRSRGTRSRARVAASAISRTVARPSDQVVWQWRSPRIASARPASSSGGATRRRPRAAPAGRSAMPGGAIDTPPRPARPAAARATRRSRPIRSRGRAPSRSRSGGATTSSTGMPSTVMPTSGVEHRDDLRQRCEPRPGIAGRVGGDRDGEPRRRLVPPARIAGHRPAERVGDPLRGVARASLSMSTRRRWTGRRVERRSDPRLGARGRLRAPRAAARPPPPRGAPRRCARRARRRCRRTAWRAKPCIRPNAASSGETVCPQLLELREPARLDQLAQPRLDAGADPAQAAAPVRRERGRRPAPASSGSGRRPAGRRGSRTCLASASSRSAAYSSSAAASSAFVGDTPDTLRRGSRSAGSGRRRSSRCRTRRALRRPRAEGPCRRTDARAWRARRPGRPPSSARSRCAALMTKMPIRPNATIRARWPTTPMSVIQRFVVGPIFSVLSSSRNLRETPLYP